jgi:hypothetical protein
VANRSDILDSCLLHRCHSQGCRPGRSDCSLADLNTIRHGTGATGNASLEATNLSQGSMSFQGGLRELLYRECRSAQEASNMTGAACNRPLYRTDLEQAGRSAHWQSVGIRYTTPVAGWQCCVPQFQRHALVVRVLP